VFLKPIDTDIIKHTGLEKIKSLDDKYKEVRIGALEVQLCRKVNNKVDTHVLHSKLATKEWPSLSKLINKILMFVPVANIQVNIFDKDLEGEEPKKKFEEVKDEDFHYSRYENIKINLYHLNIEELKLVYEKANEEVQYIINPKKRIEFLNNTKLKILEEKPSLYQEVSYKSTLRPITGKTMNTSRFSAKMHESGMGGASRINNTNTLTNMNVTMTKSNKSIRPNSTTSILRSKGVSQILKHNSQIDLEDSDNIAQLKGTLFRTLFTNKNGWINLTDIPYDSYLLEVEESKNFLVSAGIITFPKILQNKEIKKYIGLKQQINAYAEIYLYQFLDSKNTNDFNMQLLEGANIALIRSNSGHDGPFGGDIGGTLIAYYIFDYDIYNVYDVITYYYYLLLILI